MTLIECIFMAIGILAVEFIIVKFFTDLFEKGDK